MIGTCQSMCPEPEILMRERENLLHPFEVAEDHTPRRPKANTKKCVKEYRRPTVGKQDFDSREVRPPEVLVNTVDYLIDRIATKKCRWSEIYDFLFDRLRSVRQDLVIQDVHGTETVHILERAVRFHVYSDYRLCMEHIAVFDERINSQHTQECLKRLIKIYSENSTIVWPNQTEMETVYLLFNLGDLDAVKHYYTLDFRLRNNSEIEQAYKMSLAYLHNNWVGVFRGVGTLKLPIYLCAVHRHFPYIQRNALYTMNTAYSTKNLKFPLEKLRELLFLNTDTEAQTLCERFGIAIEGSSAKFLKTSFKREEKVERTHNDFISEILKKLEVCDILHGRTKLEEDLIGRFRNHCQT